MSIEYRLLTASDEMEQAVDLQQIYWGDDRGNLVPSHMLLSIASYGGHVIGAFDETRMIGVLIGFMGTDLGADVAQSAADRLLIMSKRMVVLPEYRGQKIGEELKRLQRDIAIRQGIQLVTWTFDPVLSRNAYLNLHKLRAVGQVYKEDYFGAGASHPTLSADRLVVNWWVSHPIVSERPEPSPTAPIINAAIGDNAFLKPADAVAWTDAPQLRLEVPPNFNEINDADSGLGTAWRLHVREAFHMVMRRGYIATDVMRQDDRVYYVLTLDDGSYTFTK